jgi:hypothetical protein
MSTACACWTARGAESEAFHSSEAAQEGIDRLEAFRLIE